ncbi:hypothetical protein QC764_101045 [Podospora pseudoanserina]|uniref:Uncharacterized protein n=1 Tax=Podospora pseudoanserina TaxID=2609844 RepID=A0ABR0IKQ0_9PEZI|nr:hypothetical protein QC764_101045 [Podospora pseudoanserina]
MPLNTAPILATTVYTGNWKREREYEDLQQELKEVTKRNLDIHHYKNKPLSNSQDFLSEAGTALSQLAWDDTEHPSKSEPYHAEFLSHLPPHTAVNSFEELGVYMSQAKYVISLGGSPLPDLKYGITIVPAGDESLLFMGYGDHADMPSEFRAEIHAKSKVVRKQVFDEEMKMCGSYVPHVGGGIEDFRLPPMDVLEKLFYAERVRQRRARYRELHGTRRSSDIGSQPSGDACAEHFLDEYSVPSPRSYSSRCTSMRTKPHHRRAQKLLMACDGCLRCSHNKRNQEIHRGRSCTIPISCQNLRNFFGNWPTATYG